jgi:hypothetical protein
MSGCKQKALYSTFRAASTHSLAVVGIASALEAYLVAVIDARNSRVGHHEQQGEAIGGFIFSHDGEGTRCVMTAEEV